MYKDNHDEQPYSKEEVLELVSQYETMLRNREQLYFDHNSLEDIIDYYEAAGVWDKADSAIQYGLTQYPNSGYFIAKKAMSLFEEKKYKQALEMVEKALLLSPNDLDCLILQADLYNQLGKPKLALNLLKQALQQFGKEDQSDILIAVSDVFEAGGLMHKSYKAAKRALALCPDNEMAQIRYDYIATETENYRESIAVQRKLIGKNPYNFLAWYHLGNAYYGLDRYKKAIDAYDYALAINEDFAPAYRDKADCYYELGNYPHAKKLYLTALQMGFKDADLLYSLGVTGLHLKEYDECMLFLKQTLELSPQYADAFYYMGECCKEQGKATEALEYFSKALSIDGKNDTYLYAVAEIHEKEERFELALMYYHEALEINKEVAGYYLKVASMFCMLEMVNDGIELLEFATRKFPDMAELFYVTAMLLLHEGKKQTAYIYLSRAIQLDKDGLQKVFETMPHIKNDPDINLLYLLNG
ncbi:MAG TPA: tetratricopeptide repeat protein [Chitinophagales bacterium]|nr:tetratricopeptide repeat protein [Chitinophagales bacterium]HRK29141.1 tetratricopeptide repeat protein [Chitinophagales bacterium]